MVRERNITIIRKPQWADWERAYYLALGTEGKQPFTEVTTAWKNKLIKSEHSPLRTLMYTVEMEIPYYVAMHLVRHKFGVEWYVRSQRNDRQSDYDRRAARQDMPVTVIMDANLQAIINISRRRLCNKADPETREVWQEVCKLIMDSDPDLWALDYMLAPPCAHGECNEFKPCKEA